MLQPLFLCTYIVFLQGLEWGMRGKKQLGDLDGIWYIVVVVVVEAEGRVGQCPGK